MKLNRRDRENILYALSLAIRDRSLLIDPDSPDPFNDPIERKQIAEFEALQRRFKREIATQPDIAE